MAVGNPYGKGLYGKGPYARFSSAGRPYGVGAYGAGLYAIWGGNTFVMGGATGIAFDVWTSGSQTIHQFLAPTGITWDAWTTGTYIEIHPYAVTEIVLSVQAHMTVSWDAWVQCEAGGWTTPGPCEGGAWQAPGACSVGVWTKDALV